MATATDNDVSFSVYKKTFGDGNRTSEDVTRLLQYIAKMIPEI